MAIAPASEGSSSPPSAARSSLARVPVIVRTSSVRAAAPSLCSSWGSGSRPSGSRDHLGLCDPHNPGAMSFATPARCDPRPRGHLRPVRTRVGAIAVIPARGEKEVPTAAVRGRVLLCPHHGQRWQFIGAEALVVPSPADAMPPRKSPGGRSGAAARLDWHSRLLAQSSVASVTNATGVSRGGRPVGVDCRIACQSGGLGVASSAAGADRWTRAGVRPLFGRSLLRGTGSAGALAGSGRWARPLGAAGGSLIGDGRRPGGGALARSSSWADWVEQVRTCLRRRRCRPRPTRSRARRSGGTTEPNHQGAIRWASICLSSGGRQVQ